MDDQERTERLEKIKNKEDTTPYQIKPPDLALQALDKANHRQFVIILALVAALLISNMAWLYEWTQYDYVSTETVYTQDGQGTNIIGNQNEVSDGTK